MRIATTTLFLCVVALLALGMVMLFSATAAQPEANYSKLQPLWAAVGLLAFVAANLVDYRVLKRKAVLPWIIWSLAVLLLLALFIFGAKRGGATRWLSIQGFTLQPSEFAKVALIILLAWWGSHWQRRLQKPLANLLYGLLYPALFIAPILALIFREPDWGTTILVAAVSGVMLFLAGTRWYYLAPAALAGVVGLLVLLASDSMRSDRVDAYLNPEKHKQGKAYQAYQAMLAMGSGGVTGFGLGNGRQKLGYVPEHHTDFIFSVIGEELGLVATLLVVAAYLAIVLSGLHIARQASDVFGMLLSAGLTCLIGLQAAVNMAVVTGAVPNKGIALPFISYGGSNLVLMLGCVGLLLNVARRATTTQRTLIQNPFALQESLAAQSW
jgi:cell division protein FtsW